MVTDPSNNTNDDCQVVLEVFDVTEPTVVCPVDRVVSTTEEGMRVTFEGSASDNVDRPATLKQNIVYSQLPNTTFALGRSTSLVRQVLLTSMT